MSSGKRLSPAAAPAPTPTPAPASARPPRGHTRARAKIPTRFVNALIAWTAVFALLLLWELAAESGGSLFFPPPSDILQRAQELWLSGPASRLFLTQAVFDDIVPSLARMFAGWAIAVVLGIAGGIAIGRSRLISDVTNPVLQFLRSIPAPAIIPVFLVVLGTETTMRVSLIAFGSIWPVLLNTIDGVRGVDPQQLEAARVFGLSPTARLRRVVLPAALPKILAGVRVSVALALILMVVSELVAATEGIGYQMAQAQQTFRLTDMWAGIVLLAVLGFVLNWGFTVLERRIVKWHAGSRGREES